MIISDVPSCVLTQSNYHKGNNSWYIDEKAARLNRACSHSRHSQQHFMVFLSGKSYVSAKNDAKTDAETASFGRMTTRGAANTITPSDWTPYSQVCAKLALIGDLQIDLAYDNLVLSSRNSLTRTKYLRRIID
jgi:hypothetical protein